MKFANRTEVIMEDDELGAIDEALAVLKVLKKQMDWYRNDVLSFETQSSQTEHSKSEVDAVIALFEDICDCDQIFAE